jgi:hypothetical protein
MVATQARVVLWWKIRMGLITGDAVFRACLGFWTTTGTQSSLPGIGHVAALAQLAAGLYRRRA